MTNFTTTAAFEPLPNTTEARWVVIHPLDDAPEAKVDTSNLRPMEIKGAVRFSLLTLRAYLLFMLLLVLYRVLCQANLLGLHS